MIETNRSPDCAEQPIENHVYKKLVDFHKLFWRMITLFQNYTTTMFRSWAINGSSHLSAYNFKGGYICYAQKIHHPLPSIAASSQVVYQSHCLAAASRTDVGRAQLVDLVSLAKARAMKPFKLNRTGSRVKSVYIYIIYTHTSYI